jgi:hypothetical protein
MLIDGSSSSDTLSFTSLEIHLKSNILEPYIHISETCFL